MRMRLRDHTASILVTLLSSAFGVLLLQGTSVLTTLVAGDDISQKQSVQLALSLVAVVFFAIAVYVGGVVTANTVGTVIAGRTRVIALYRLVGASATSLRRAVAVDGLLVGLVGSVLGFGVASGIASGSVGLGVATGAIPDLSYELFSIGLIVPVVAVILVTWLASWVGSRRILDVTPIQAGAAAVEPSRDEASARPVRNVVAFLLIGLGVMLLAGGVALGLVSMFGLLVALLGGILSFSGIVLGAPLFMPAILRLVGRMLGRGPAAKIAAANAVRNPARSTRATIGVVIGVTLVTMFAVAAQGYVDTIMRGREAYPADYGDSDQVLSMTITVFAVLFGFSALIAAVGMVNNLSLSVLQRTRELGLLRALGFTRAQIRGMILAESIQMTVAAVGFGLVLGIVYGWAGAQSLLGSIQGGGFALPSVPWLVLVVAVLAAAVLSTAASIAPSRRATRISPVAALAVE
ncbi:FtsX-like permease family protein [Mycetocola sp. 2940]|uniref:ABC transporter permease n=1 Tax=Mycetocola sp. 2940 TaxID=3156452 RepID=UPI00339559DC